MIKRTIYQLLFFCFSLIFCSTQAQKPPKPIPPLEFSKGKLTYTADSLGNRIPDFSYCGYKASEQHIPNVDIKIVVPIIKGDATKQIQSAINYVATLPIDATGFRGAVLLQKGVYEVLGQLKISASGIVLRGSGINETTLLGAGTDRQTLIRIHGKNNQQKSEEVKITDAYVPVNAMQFSVADASKLKVGNKIIIHRPSTKEWISELGTNHFGGGITSLGWKAGEQDIFFDRMITDVSGLTVKIDAPLTTALDAKFGGGFVSTYQWNDRIENIGVENMLLKSSYDKTNPKDEAHRWMAITIENAADVWARQLKFQHFAGSAVYIDASVKRVTVEDCISTQPISEIGGQRRYTFFTAGQQTLFQRCYAENGYHDFATGYCAAGPNAFVQCESILPYNFSGAIDSWSSGILFDVVNVDGNAIRFGNRGQDAQGAGWCAANSLLWNCTAARIDCYQPPTAQNWSFGSWAQFAGNGSWWSSNDAMNPRSLFYTQLKERLNKNIDAQAQILAVPTEASSSPTIEVATQLTKEAAKPRMQLKEWISLPSPSKGGIAIPTDFTNNLLLSDIQYKEWSQKLAAKNPPLEGREAAIKNGVLVRGNQMLVGRRQGVPWWSGGVKDSDIKKAQLAITRFVPGRVGYGLTDDLDEVTTIMQQRNIIGLEQNYGLWYDRRRDDHERIRRMDGEVWPPFYELPFARSGKETAWDGLSKYDLTKYNSWYWNRLKQFANLADAKGLLLVHQHYFQHNIIEAGAHYADFPWRTANNINNTGFPEPVPYAGDKRIFMAEQFYDITNPVRKELHRKYISQCLNNFKDDNGVIQLIGEEFTGPLHFVQFWLDVIQEWEKETGKSQIIGLSTTKDVQDAILQNPVYNKLIDVIDIRYWHYQADGTTYEPKGGQNLAPRQHARLLKPKKTSFEQVYKAVSEYKIKYPNKAVMYSSDSWDAYAWAVLMAGGSLPAIPAETDKSFLTTLATAKPAKAIGTYVLSNDKNIIAYADSSNLVTLDLSEIKGSFKVKYLSSKDGKLLQEETIVEGDKQVKLNVPARANIVWLSK